MICMEIFCQSMPSGSKSSKLNGRKTRPAELPCQGEPDAGIRVPPRHNPVQPVSCGEAPKSF